MLKLKFFHKIELIELTSNNYLFIINYIYIYRFIRINLFK